MKLQNQMQYCINKTNDKTTQQQQQHKNNIIQHNKNAFIVFLFCFYCVFIVSHSQTKQNKS